MTPNMSSLADSMRLVAERDKLRLQHLITLSEGERSHYLLKEIACRMVSCRLNVHEVYTEERVLLEAKQLLVEDARFHFAVHAMLGFIEQLLSAASANTSLMKRVVEDIDISRRFIHIEECNCSICALRKLVKRT